MSYDLSMLVPSIRKDNLNKLYNSIKESFSGTFEFIVIGPYGLPKELEGISNVLFIPDWGSPIRAQQRGFCSASGKFTSYGADDGVFLPGALDIAYNKIKDLDKMNLVMGKYQEGERKDSHMENDDYYILNKHHGSMAAFIPDNCWMLNVGLIPTELIKEVGGWDSDKFQCCPCAYNDLSIRLQKYGVKYHIQNEMMFSCSHLPGLMGDHFAVHTAQTQHDEPMFKEIWNHPYWSNRIAISLDNWKSSPERWRERFGDK